MGWPRTDREERKLPGPPLRPSHIIGGLGRSCLRATGTDHMSHNDRHMSRSQPWVAWDTSQNPWCSLNWLTGVARCPARPPPPNYVGFTKRVEDRELPRRYSTGRAQPERAGGRGFADKLRFPNDAKLLYKTICKSFFNFFLKNTVYY